MLSSLCWFSSLTCFILWSISQLVLKLLLLVFILEQLFTMMVCQTELIDDWFGTVPVWIIPNCDESKKADDVEEE